MAAESSPIYYIWLNVVLVANTNGRLAIPALAGLLVWSGIVLIT